MSWERHYNSWYYTRSKRVGGHVVRTYFGRGPEAEAAAAEDEQRRQKQLAARRREELEWADLAAVEQTMAEYHATIDLLVRAQMSCLGYHYHRGEWRKRRGFQPLPAEQEQEATRREGEQQSSAWEPEQQTPESKPIAPAENPPPRRPLPTPETRSYGPGMIRDFARPRFGHVD